MDEDMRYTDLRYSIAPLGWSTTFQEHGTAPTDLYEAENTYENLKQHPVGKEPAGHPDQQCRDPRCNVQLLSLFLLAACLALLATSITLGVCYWLKGKRLGQQLWQAGAALSRAQDQLAQAQAELVQAWQDGNHSQEEAENCCPETWVLHHGKCLFLSKEKKTWDESKVNCERESSQLLVLWDWNGTTMPSFLTNMDASYWIGLWYERSWTWIDGTPYPDVQKLKGYEDRRLSPAAPARPHL
ncbi:hypothetical protein Y1Q_0005438 [Alligator mississippiensis]|uniref:C-type lectin domain-containing protein n=1 Tax=Alligator mississippiensis TaxID=8496 RepID=A0A151NR07_ALLMI|nr:hypothetical protein Y1Q_0005438 [Alligator mississippiensis]